MRYLVGGAFAVFTLLLVVGAIRGRVRVRSCCAIADPTRDLRMRGAMSVPGPGTDPASPEDR